MNAKILMKHHFVKKEAITDLDYSQACLDFEIKNLGEYHYFYLKCHMLLLTDDFESFRKMCLKIFELHPAKFFSDRGLA